MKFEKNTYVTKWAQKPPPYGAFEDYVTIETSTGLSYVMHEHEFEWIAEKLHELYFQKKKSKYIQILKEWNETIGFSDIEAKPSIIKDLSDTIDALSYVEAGPGEKYGEPSKEDLAYLKQFLMENKLSTITIKKE